MKHHTYAFFLVAILIFMGAPRASSLTIKDGRFYRNGKIFSVHGLNWFGFNNGQTMVDGLWAGGSATATDFLTIVDTIKLLGFNTVRLPFVFKDLQLPTTDKTMPCTPVTAAEIISRTISPSFKGPKKTRLLPRIRAHKSRVCNDYLPKGRTIERFIWVIQQFVKNDFVVIIDYHPMNLEQTANNPKLFTESWKNVWNTITRHPDYKSMKMNILVDIFNEPDSMGISWTGTAVKPSLTKLYLDTMDALYKLDNGTLFMIEGAGQTGMGINWGDGFVTDKALIAKHNIDHPTIFFKTLEQKPYKENIIISPHIYGPSVTLSKSGFSGHDFFYRLNASFGYLSDKHFPILLGEFGSKFLDTKDLVHLNDLAKWMRMRLKDLNWVYWAYNENSGDTGGIVENGWKDLAWKKLNWLISNLNLRPWYLM